MEARVRALFERYAAHFNRAIRGDVDLDANASFYASDFIVASPLGVMSGKNDASLRTVMEQGYAHYRAIGTRDMRILELRITPIDTLHCTASVRWRAVYERPSRSDVALDFDVHYLVQFPETGDAKIFGWVAGDEESELAKHGIG